MHHLSYGLVWSEKNISNFCYLIRVEHEKCSEMCVWIVSFGQKIEKMGLLLVKKVNIGKEAFMSFTPSLPNSGFR
jgi:hypothetical protein